MKYEVDMSRIVSQYKTFIVEASSEAEACHKAKANARHMYWKKGDGEADNYYVECCTTVS